MRFCSLTTDSKNHLLSRLPQIISQNFSESPPRTTPNFPSSRQSEGGKEISATLISPQKERFVCDLDFQDKINRPSISGSRKKTDLPICRRRSASEITERSFIEARGSLTFKPFKKYLESSSNFRRRFVEIKRGTRRDSLSQSSFVKQKSKFLELSQTHSKTFQNFPIQKFQIENEAQALTDLTRDTKRASTSLSKKSPNDTVKVDSVGYFKDMKTSIHCDESLNSLAHEVATRGSDARQTLPDFDVLRVKSAGKLPDFSSMLCSQRVCSRRDVSYQQRPSKDSELSKAQRPTVESECDCAEQDSPKTLLEREKDLDLQLPKASLSAKHSPSPKKPALSFNIGFGPVIESATSDQSFHKEKRNTVSVSPGKPFYFDFNLVFDTFDFSERFFEEEIPRDDQFTKTGAKQPQLETDDQAEGLVEDFDLFLQEIVTSKDPSSLLIKEVDELEVSVQNKSEENDEQLRASLAKFGEMFLSEAQLAESEASKDPFCILLRSIPNH